MRDFGERMVAGRKPREAIAQLDEKMKTVITVVRRLGLVLLKAHEICEADLIAAGFKDTAAVLRDELKPLIDALIHFDVERGDDDGDAPAVSTDLP